MGQTDGKTDRRREGRATAACRGLEWKGMEADSESLWGFKLERALLPLDIRECSSL